MLTPATWIDGDVSSLMYQMPGAVAETVHRALTKSRDQRYQHIRELIDAVTRWPAFAASSISTASVVIPMPRSRA